jgi:CxxC motif-containing protein (DUF1111 family)
MGPQTVRVHTRFLVAAAALLALQAVFVTAADRAHDPGVRGGAAAAGGPLEGLTGAQIEYFLAGKDEFTEAEDIDEGLGPRMNLDNCAECHLHPSVGGSSPAVNPQVAFAGKNGGTDQVPSFITLTGPVREARFVRNADGSPDGGVHALFTVAGRSGADECAIEQPNFAQQLANRNVVFRIPTPAFGAGLIEMIPDSQILAGQSANAAAKRTLGIRGRANFQLAGRAVSGQTNNNGNDGTIARFGWKAQNKSLLLFSGEAYNVEMGISNELFQTERDEMDPCQYGHVPNSDTDPDAAEAIDAVSAIEKFALFMRFLAPPTPSTDLPGTPASIANGRALFDRVGCALCHTSSFTTSKYAAVAALREKRVDLFSDLLVHDMGIGLADGVSQGGAGPREFRTAPLWGLGQRIFLLHDGRTSDLVAAIRAHASVGSEANGAVAGYLILSDGQKQDLLNFLRSL